MSLIMSQTEQAQNLVTDNHTKAVDPGTNKAKGTPNNNNVKSGHIRMELAIPGTTSSAVLFIPKHSKITITGENITNPILVEREIPLSGRQQLNIPQVPVGANTALIQVIDSNGTVLANRVQNFYMTDKAKMDLGRIDMGIKITNTGSSSYISRYSPSGIEKIKVSDIGSCSPSNVKIPFNTTLFWENWDYNSDRTVSMNNGSVKIGPIPSAIKAAAAGGHDTFFDTSHTFTAPSGGEGRWTVMYEESDDMPVYTVLFQIKAFSDNDIVAVGQHAFEDGTSSPCIMRYNGSTWNVENAPADLEGDLFISMAANSSEDIYAGTHWSGTIMHYTGGTWEKVYQSLYGGPVSGIWITASRDIYATHENHILHYEGGTTWSVAYTSPNSALASLWGYQDVIYAAGNFGIIVKGSDHDFSVVEDFDPSGWTNYVCMWGTSPNDIFAGGWRADKGDGDIRHYDGIRWSKMPDLPHWLTVTSIAGTSSSDVYAVQEEIMNHYDGNEWTEMEGVPIDPDVFQYFRGCSISPSGNLYVAGVNIILKYEPEGAPKSEETYVYDEGLGAPGSVFCFTPPVLISISDADNDNGDPVEGASLVTFTLRGMHFGESRTSVNGRVRFIDMNNYTALEATTGTWSDDTITGSITIPGGLYLVEVTANGCPSTDKVYFTKGSAV